MYSRFNNTRQASSWVSRDAQTGGLIFFNMRYDKPVTNPIQQLDKMKERGFIIPDNNIFQKRILSIGYYRLSAYTLPFEVGYHDDGTRNHQLKRPTYFDEILDLYEFDRRLRLHVIDAIERIEVALRSRWSDQLALESNSHAYLNSTYFRDQIEYAKDLVKLHTDITRSTESYIDHYKQQYNDPPLPPVWVAVGTTSLGQLSRWYKNTASTNVKREVMRYFGMPTIEAFEGVLHSLTPVRNICAHHGRLWNRKFTFRLPNIKVLKEQLIPHSQHNTNDLLIHNYLVVINALMKNASLDTDWFSNLKDLLNSRHPWQLTLMGFGTDWMEKLPWSQ